MIVSSTYDEVKKLISDFIISAQNNQEFKFEDTEVLITNSNTTLINNIFKDFSVNVVSTRHFKDGTSYLVVKMGQSELMLQIVLDHKVCPIKNFQVKRLADLHKVISDKDIEFSEDEFLRLLEDKGEQLNV